MTSLKRSNDGGNCDTDSERSRTQLEFSIQLKRILSQIGVVTRPDLSRNYVELQNGNGALAKLKTFLTDCIVGKYFVDERKIWKLLHEVMDTPGFDLLNLFWSIPIESGVKYFVAVLNYIADGLHNFGYSQCVLTENYINMLMLVQHNGFEELVPIVGEFIYSSSHLHTLDEVAFIFVKTFERLENEFTPFPRLIKFAMNIEFSISNEDDDLCIYQQEILELLTVQPIQETFMTLLSYMVKYGNYDFFFKVFERYFHLIRNGQYRNCDLIKFIQSLCNSTKFSHITGAIETNKREQFLEKLLKHQAFEKGFSNRKHFISGILSNCSEWSIKLFMRIHDLCNVDLSIYSNNFKDFGAFSAFKQEQCLKCIVDNYDSNKEHIIWFSTENEQRLYYEIVDRIDQLFANSKVSKDLIPHILLFQFSAHSPDLQSKVEKMIHFLVNKRADACVVKRARFARFGIVSSKK